jgi:DNA-binding CsgD family transcriptional regulator
VTRVGVDSGSRDLVGREEQLSRLDGFLRGPQPRAFVLVGDPGAGKTSLWEAGIDAARGFGLRVLDARPSGAEARLSFAGLTDLLEDVDVSALTAVPAPQRHALEVALLRTEPTGPGLQPRAISTGLLNALRELAENEPVIVAVDDVQWLDRSSGEALAFAARRLDGSDVRFLLAKRPGRPSDLENALADGLDELPLMPLSLGATRRLLFHRYGLSLPRRVVRSVHESSGGNPLYVLEIGRTLTESGPPQIGEELPVPELVEDLVGVRVAGLPRPVRRLLLAVALSPGLRASQLEALTDHETLDEALDAGVLVVDGERVRPSHPLLAAAARKRARARDRRELHLELAVVVEQDELRARHLALSASGPAPGLAPTIAAAAHDAAARGARQEAAELAEQALRLTPDDDPERAERVLALGQYLYLAGDVPRMRLLVEPALDSLPPGSPRVWACRLLCEGLPKLEESRPYLERALAEAGDDPALRAWVLIEKAGDRVVLGVEGLAEVETLVERFERSARTAGPHAERDVLQTLAWTRSVRGRAIDDVCERFLEVSETASFIAAAPMRVAGQRHVWRGEIERAREIFTDLRRTADEHGEPLSYALQRLHLCELELRIGNWDAAEQLLDDWAEAPEEEAMLPPMHARCRALLAAGRGLPDEAGRWADEAVERGVEGGFRWDVLEAQRASGIAALLAHDPARAAESLREVWEHTEREGVLDPGVFPAAPDLVESVCELGKTDEACDVTRRLRELAEGQQHPWGLATARRCEGLVGLAAKRYDDGASDLEGAASRYRELGLRFDEARVLLALGRGQRRQKKWGAARGTLEEATATFDEMGSPGWAEEARSELARVGARRPQAKTPGGLTKTETRVAELAAQGLSNKEIASTLFVTVHTVEVHLSHAYAKLGIRSRSQLGPRLSASA